MLISMMHIDKNSIKHFSVCFLLSLAGGYGVAAALGASLTKEYCDYQTYGHWCWWDMTFDLLGCVAGYATHVVVRKWIGF